MEKNRCRHCSWLDMNGDGTWKCLYNWKNCFEVIGGECPVNDDLSIYEEEINGQAREENP